MLNSLLKELPKGSLPMLGFVGLGFFCIGMLGPVMPLYLNSLRFGSQGIGILYAISTLASALGSPFLGRQLDAGRLRPVAVGALVGLGFSIALMLYGQSWAVLLLAFAMEGFFLGSFLLFGRWYMGVYAAPENKTVAMAADMAVIAGVEGIGALSGGWIAAAIGHRAVIALGAGLPIICGLLLFFHQRARPIVPQTAPDGAAKSSSGKLLLRSPKLWLLGSVSALIVICWAVVLTYLPLLADKAISASEARIGVLFALMNLLQFVLVIPLARISARGGNLFIIAAIGCVGAALLGFVRGESFAMFVAASVLFALGSSMFFPATAATLSSGAAADEQGRLLAALGIFEESGFVIGPLLGGFLWDAAGMRSPFAFAAWSAALGLLLWILFSGRVGMRRAGG